MIEPTMHYSLSSCILTIAISLLLCSLLLCSLLLCSLLSTTSAQSLQATALQHPLEFLPTCPVAEMNFTLVPAIPADAPRLAEIYFSAFTNELSRRLFPRAEDTEAFQIRGLEENARETQSGGKKTSLIKVVGTNDAGEEVIAGYALWKFHGDQEETTGKGAEKTEWPGSSDGELCDSFFGKVTAERERAVGEQRHYYLSILAIDPAFGRQGLGAKLLKWGLDRADEERVITFISASPQGRGLYEKHNCRALNNYEVVPGYRETSMIRPVGGMSRR
ncbi:hypothetical protein BJY04DRAFT_184900 [Aspergillus karnatakaensis]|uniref:GNAT family N-acetyltransferase n=1 Tax=Aspergillus karnatakaensis TaxID=1810916 RepID=UPI003CCD85CD